MINLLKLIWTKTFGGHNEHIDGSNLFAGEYTDAGQYMQLPTLYRPTQTMRMPYRRQEYNTFRQSVLMANKCGIEVVALLDMFENNDSMMSRLAAIKKDFPFIKHIELFNELPHMSYPGETINTLEQLIVKTNKYSDWIHAHNPGVKVITMAPYNSIDERAFPAWGGLTNTRILKDLILYTTADLAAIHIYGDSFGKQLAMVELASNLREWNDEAKYKKGIWITEIGDDNWNRHVSYYHSMIRLSANVLNPEKIIWYRQTAAQPTSPDSPFALETRNPAAHSPLWDELKG